LDAYVLEWLRLQWLNILSERGPAVPAISASSCGNRAATHPCKQSSR
jgi:hypothetical protein